LLKKKKIRQEGIRNENKEKRMIFIFKIKCLYLPYGGIYTRN
jgi:hypothetical protein